MVGGEALAEGQGAGVAHILVELVLGGLQGAPRLGVVGDHDGGPGATQLLEQKVVHDGQRSSRGVVRLVVEQGSDHRPFADVSEGHCHQAPLVKAASLHRGPENQELLQITWGGQWQGEWRRTAPWGVCLRLWRNRRKDTGRGATSWEQQGLRLQDSGEQAHRSHRRPCGRSKLLLVPHKCPLGADTKGAAVDQGRHGREEAAQKKAELSQLMGAGWASRCREGRPGDREGPPSLAGQLDRTSACFSGVPVSME